MESILATMTTLKKITCHVAISTETFLQNITVKSIRKFIICQDSFFFRHLVQFIHSHMINEITEIITTS